VKWIKKIDRKYLLEVNSSQLNYWVLDGLISEFPKAKFILTIRDCYSWLDSFINHSLSRPCSDQWAKLRDLRFKRPQFKYAKQEEILIKHNLYTLDGYLSYWAEHSEEVIRTVPKERLLIIRTDEINISIEKVANYLGILSSTLNYDKAHLYKARQKFNILSKIDRKFLDEKINVHCKELMSKYFPEFINSNRVVWRCNDGRHEP